MNAAEPEGGRLRRNVLSFGTRQEPSMLFNYRQVDDPATRVGYIVGDVFVVLFIGYMVISLFVVG